MSRPIVAVDARRALWMPGTGIGRYVAQLVRPDAAGATTIVPVIARGQELPGAVVVPAGLGQLQRIAWEQALLPRAARRQGWAVIHAPYYETAVVSGTPVVVTVQDLHTIHAAGDYATAFRLYYNTVLRLLSRTAARIIVPSQATADDVIALRPRVASRVRVIPYGHDASLLGVATQHAADPAAAPVILYTGGYGPRKRLDVLIEAFVVALRSVPQARLTLVGRVPDDVTALLVRHGVEAHTDRPGFVSEEELRALYASASVAAYPSEYEGFGFPALEALTAGVPLVASDTSSIPEITGSHATLVPPGQVEPLAAGLVAALERGPGIELQVRGGLERAREFSWDRCRAEHDAVYLEVA